MGVLVVYLIDMINSKTNLGPDMGRVLLITNSGLLEYRYFM